MSTMPLTYPAGRGREGSGAVAARRSELAPRALAAALLLVVLYAVFAHGAVGESTYARVEVALAAIAALAGSAWLWTGTLRFGAPRLVLVGVALLALFAAWSGITVLWSVSADGTWVELNRALSYVLVLCLAIALGATEPRAPAWISRGFAALAFVVTWYAIGQKLIPGLHIGGLINLDQTGAFPRLQQPIGYWNALALFLVLGVPNTLALVVDERGNRRWRAAAAISLSSMLVAIAFTFSRGGLIALVVALAVAIGLGSTRLRALMWLGIAVAAAIPSLIVGLTDHSLTSAHIALGSRESAGLLLCGVLLVSMLALGVAAWRLQAFEARHPIGAATSRRIVRVLVAGAGVLLVVGVLAVAFSSRGLTGTASHLWSSFTTTRVTSDSDPTRLLSADSENRWVWWKEAAGAFSDRPVFGWGAGSFPVVHLLYRQDRLSVSQPHSVPLQFLAETGMVGGLLALAAFGLLLAGAIRRAVSSPERLVGALVAGAAAYLVHGLYDWDWNIPAVSLPAFMFLGVVTGAPPARRARQPGMGTRAVLLGALTLCLCTFALSVALPSLAASKAGNALLAAAAPGSAPLRHATSSADLASRLDPLSDAGLRVLATLALRRGDQRSAIHHLVAAVQRQPSDASAWQELALLEIQQGNYRDGMRAATRLLELDPYGVTARSAAHHAAAAVNLAYTPPGASALARRLP
ncbi:MAG: O-antigen ligase family protein [Solirubrobacteraceae bacterium]